MRIVQIGLAAVLLTFSAPSQDAVRHDDVTGLWKGTLRAGPTDLRLVLDIARDAAGSLTATLDSIDQRAKDLPVDRIAFDAGSLKFEMKALRASFRGRIAADGQTIEGTFTQGADLPLTWTRTDEAPVLARPQEPTKPYPYREEKVYYSHDPKGDPAEVAVADASTKPEGRVRLAGTLTLPETGAPHPAVVLVSGSGPQNRDEALMGHRPFLVLADALTRRGIAVLRYDDRGVGESTGNFGTALTTDFAQDALAGVHYLRSRPDIAADRIGIVGHSEGGLVAPIAANRSKLVAFIVLLAGPSVSGAEVVAHQTQLIARAMGESEEAIESGAEINRDLFEILRTADADDNDEELVSQLGERLEAAYDEMPADAKEKAGDKKKFVDSRIKRLTSPWFRFFATYDPAPALREVRCPVLAVFGEKDLQVDPRQNLPNMKAALADNDDVTVVELPGLNHLFQTCDTGSMTEYATIEETFAPIALEVIGAWITERFGR